MGIKPGIYENMPNDVYRSHTDWMSNSELSLFLSAPRLYQYRILEGNKTPSGKVQKEGTAVHSAVLEPNLFLQEYGRLPELDLRTKVGKETKARLESEYPNKIFLPAEDYDRYADCSDLVHQNYGDLLGKGKAEVSFFWIDEDTGVQCKARADMAFMEDAWVLDLKTTKDPKDFAHSVTLWKYHRQAAYYLDGLSKLTGKKWTRWEWLAVSHERPFLMTLHSAKQEDLDLGRFEYKQALKAVKQCQERKEYPALPLHSGECGVSSWYHQRALAEKQEQEKREVKYGT